jgi:hypothetical protein
MTEESVSGTCFMSDGRYETLGGDNLASAFKLIEDRRYVLPLSERNELREMYYAATACPDALERNIEKSKAQFLQRVEHARLAFIAKDATKPKKFERVKAPPKTPLRDITLGTKVSRFFEWTELDAELRKIGPLGKGQWRTGSIIKIVKNKSRKVVYTCVFDTPGKYTNSMNADVIKIV